MRDHDGSLVMSGHRYESVSPYEWTALMRDAISGTVFTVDDDVHGSVLRVPECAAKLVAYFETGSPGASGCHGVPLPQGPAPTASSWSTQAADWPLAVSTPSYGLPGQQP